MKQKLSNTNTVAKKKAKVEDLKQIALEQKPVPDIFITPLAQPKQKKIGQLPWEQIQHFFDKGYLLVEDFFAPERLNIVREAVDDLVDKLANDLYEGGKIKNKHEDKTFFNRLTHIEKEFKGAAVLLHKNGILPKAFQDLWSDERLLNVVEQIIGPEIAGHPVWNLRTKTPHNEQTTVPWHQDLAYMHPRSLQTLQLTAWIPLVDANNVNGCMQVASGGHRKGKGATHTCCAGGTWYVQLDEKDMVKELGVDLEKDIVTCEVPYGGILFLNNIVPHQSLENRSENIRWSLDLRWQTPDEDNGFFGMKESVLMRTSKDPNHKIDWSEWAKVDRNKLQMEEAGENDDQFSTEIAGPWMRRWDIVHHNRHTESFTRNTDWHKA